jgi:hypothetical protein
MMGLAKLKVRLSIWPIYPCLRYREGSEVKFEHLAPEKAEELKPALERRKKLQADLKANKKRVATLNTILLKE